MPVCSHLDQIRVTALPASIDGCEESLCSIDEVGFIVEPGGVSSSAHEGARP